MARQFPGLGLTGAWLESEDGWGDAMNANLRTVSILSALSVNGVVDEAELPGAPTDGMIYIVLDGADAMKVWARDNGVWVKLSAPPGITAWETPTNTLWRFSGAAWSVQATDLPAFGEPQAGMVLRITETGDALEWVPANPEIPAYGAGQLGQFLSVTGDGTELAWASLTGLPSYGAPQIGQVLRVNATGDATEWFTLEAELPSYGVPEAGQVLKVNATGDGVEWGVDGTGDTLPSYSVSEAGRVLKVNGTGDATEWGVDGTGDTLPSYSAAQAGNVLKVNATGDATEWATDETGGGGTTLPGYAGNTGKVLKVNATEDGVEWATDETGGGTSLPSFVGNTGKHLAVNATEDAVEWVDPPEALPTYGAPDAAKRLAVNGAGDGLVWVDPPTSAALIATAMSTATAHTITASDLGQLMHYNTSTSTTITVPADATENLPTGFSVMVRQHSTGGVTFVAGSGATLQVPADFNAATRAVGSVVTLVKIWSDLWVIFGDLEASV
ncbi:DUF2793 domain-containing protein [Gemmobacter lutimaris]|uniref:DUF2793 domain-containing protein n=1 Tax=Gemmobacter lutimaris TaxID=2306023 RepID=A0A398BME6_9RHOB|nr:DUF2793 domain-containing protein [Gemmobacter lutimaris]RID91879.1 DUF2793 domain-containing protein [Gemmobacter lutimaris]